MANIAIFGGTFNPFHIGHYEMLNSVCRFDFVNKVFVMPDKIPPHKKCDYIVDDVHRISMCGLVCNDFEKAQLCLIEFEREGKSYTLDTVKKHKKKYPDDNFFIVNTIFLWYNQTEILNFRRKPCKKILKIFLILI